MERPDNPVPVAPDPSRTGSDAPVVSPTQARQGEAPGHVRYVLAISTTLVIAAFAIIYFLYF